MKENEIIIILFLLLVTTGAQETFTQYHYDEINHRLTQNPIIL